VAFVIIMKLTKIILEITGWLVISLGTVLGAGFVAVAMYLQWIVEWVKIIAFIIVSTSFIQGAACATHIWVKHGTIEWLSGIR